MSLRRTKIVATLGPASDTVEVLEAMVRAGVNVVRLNFSHGEAEDHARRARLIRECAERVGADVAILGDLQGPKIRIARFTGGSAMLEDGSEFFLDASIDPREGTADGVGLVYQELPQDVEPGNVLLLDDGLIVLEVTAVAGTRVDTRVITGGVLKDNKGINLKGGGLSAAALTDKDRADIETAVALDLDYLAVSFPRDAADMMEARNLVEMAGGSIGLVAKIERAEAVENLDEIIDASDVIMVARGDLAVEVGAAEVPGLQKHMIHAARDANRIVITATQMMESMISSPVPTRAEVSDVANAVMDGTDAVMLSAETAAGKYPVKVIEAMDEICRAAERQRAMHRSSHRIDEHFERIDEAIAMATMYTANHLGASAIVALTESGYTALWMSRIRSGIPIFALTRKEATRRRVCLYRGVFPVAFDVVDRDPERILPDAAKALTYLGVVEEGDLIVFTKGDFDGIAGGTNAMKIMRVPAPPEEDKARQLDLEDLRNELMKGQKNDD